MLFTNRMILTFAGLGKRTLLAGQRKQASTENPNLRDVAQPGSALAWGARGRKFESCRPDFKAFRPLKAFLLGTFGQRKKDKQ